MLKCPKPSSHRPLLQSIRHIWGHPFPIGLSALGFRLEPQVRPGSLVSLDPHPKDRMRIDHNPLSLAVFREHYMMYELRKREIIITITPSPFGR